MPQRHDDDWGADIIFNDDLYDELDDIDNAAGDDNYSTDDDYRRPHDNVVLHLFLDNRTVDYFDQLAVRMFGACWSAWFG